MAQGLDLLRVDNTDVAEHVSRRWELVRGFPLPKWDMQCPCCQSGDVQIRTFGFHRRGGSPHPYRCNIAFKCRECSLAWTHGVVMSSQPRTGNYDWREAREELGV